MSGEGVRQTPVPFVADIAATEVVDVTIEDIDRNDRSFQYRLGMIVADLRRSIEREGQKEPVDLAGTKPPYRIVDGFRRVEAIHGLGWKSVKAFVHRGLSDEEAYKLSFIKNVFRRNLTPIERANAIYQAIQRGMKPAVLACEFGLSQRQLRRYKEMLSFPKVIQEGLERGRITMAHAWALAKFKVPDTDDWVRRIHENGISARRLRREIRKLPERRWSLFRSDPAVPS